MLAVMAARGKGKQRADEAKARQSTEIEVAPLVLNKWDSSAVKNGLDDTAKKIMVNHFGCVEDFSLVDRRLLLCTVACGFSGFALVYDYLFPFPQSRTILAFCAISYFVLMGVLSVYSYLVEGTVFMVARQRDSAGVGPDTVWTLSSSLPRFGHVYSLTVTCSRAEKEGTSKIEKSVTEWFDEEGALVSEVFSSDFAGLYEKAFNSSKTQ